MKKEIEVVKCSVNELVEKVNNYQSNCAIVWYKYKKNDSIKVCMLNEYKSSKKVTPLLLVDFTNRIHYTTK